MHKKTAQRLGLTFYRKMQSLCISGLWGLGLFIYARSLFVEKSPIQKRNVHSSIPIYKKGVILVIDGVRSDAIHTVSFEKQTKYHNNFTVLNSIPKKDVFKAVSIADLPTGTAMRILSIFSGIPTTLLSAQRSFKKQSSGVDNFISQLQARNHSFLFYGDETWSYLFPEIKPNIGEVYHPYGLVPFSEERRLIEMALDAHNTNDFIIIHLISPDSYGHVYGTDSSEVQTALQIINEFIARLYKVLSDDSFIAVLSDHGVNDDGSHGGTLLKEKAASFMFISKSIHSRESKPVEKPLIESHSFSNRMEKDTTSNYVESSHKGSNKRSQSTDLEKDLSNTSGKEKRKEIDRVIYKKYKEEISQLHITEEVNIISQNDILPTLCALIGLPVPYNASGSLIRELLPLEQHADMYKQEIHRQQTALSYLKNAKNLIASNDLFSESNTRDVYQINEMLGNEIHDLFHVSSMLGMCMGTATMIMGILVHFYVFKMQWTSVFLCSSLLAIFMVAHSVYSVIHEDVISLGMCLVFSWPLCQSWKMLLLPIMTLLVGEFPLHSVDRFYFIRWIRKIPSRWNAPFFENACFFCSIACFAVYWIYFVFLKSKASYLKTVGSVLFAGSRFFSSGVPCISRSAVLLASPSLLPVLLYPSVPALCFLYVFCPIVSESVSCMQNSTQLGCFLFFLIKIMFFVTGHNHALSSINWEAAFLFSSKSIPAISGCLVASDLVLPFLYVAYTLGQRNIHALHTIVLLQAACAVLGCLVNFWFLGQSLMWFIFTGRTVFECFFLITFALVSTAMCLWASTPLKKDLHSPYVCLSTIESVLDSKRREFMK